MPLVEKILWGILLLQIIVFPIYFYSGPESVFKHILLILPVIGTILHAFWTLGVSRGIFFLTLASTLGFIFEVLGLNYGVIFGGSYNYNPGSNSLFGVPFSVIIYWAIFIYTGYCIVNSFLYWLNLKKPSFKKNGLTKLVFLIILDGLIVVSIDLFMDPIMVIESRWSWTEAGDYFGVPWGNFLGWFTVAVLSSGIFRIYEYFYPEDRKSIAKSVFFIPVIGFSMLYASLVISAWQHRLYLLSLIGTLVMLPTILINSWLYYRFIKKSPHEK